jgi:hypothetical protein
MSRCPHSVMSQVGCRRCTLDAGHGEECRFNPVPITAKTEPLKTWEELGQELDELTARFEQLCQRDVCPDADKIGY